MDQSLITNISYEFKCIIGVMLSRFKAMTQVRQGRTFHKLATVCSGILEINQHLDIPKHPIFVPSAQFPVIVRHANGVQDDDASIDNRGATLRVLYPESPQNYGSPLLDLLMTTG